MERKTVSEISSDSPLKIEKTNDFIENVLKPHLWTICSAPNPRADPDLNPKTCSWLGSNNSCILESEKYVILPEKLKEMHETCMEMYETSKGFKCPYIKKKSSLTHQATYKIQNS